MKQISFSINSKTSRLIDSLKDDFNVTSTAAVIRRALALARICVEYKDEDNAVTFIDKNGKKRAIVLG